MSKKGRIVAGALAPHPPHLIYAENPPQNEAKSEGGWEMLRWGYERLHRELPWDEIDAIIVHSPHWQTYVGTHLLGVPHFKGKSVDPIFPHLFRYNYELDVDVELSKAIHDAGKEAGLQMKMMTNPDYRVDYGTIISCHLANPKWNKPIVAISSERSNAYYNVDVMQERARALGEATRKAVEASGKNVLLLSSNSLSHRHFVTEGELPEDMSKEHITSHMLYLWDMELIKMMKAGRTREMIDVMPEFTANAIAETDAGSLTWMMSTMGYPTYPAEVYAYGSIIGTGNAIVGWHEDPNHPVRKVAQ